MSGQWLDRLLDLDGRAGDRAALLTIRSRALYAAAQLALNLGQHTWATAFAREELALGQRAGGWTSAVGSVLCKGHIDA